MIDFQNASYVKLGRIDYTEVASRIDPLLIEGEQGYLAFKACVNTSCSRASGS